MDHLQVDDEIMVMDTETGSSSYQKVGWFIHKDAAFETDFVAIETESGLRLTLTNEHLLPLVPCDLALGQLDTSYASVFQQYAAYASRAKAGQCVLSGQSQTAVDRVVRVSVERKQGIYSPITRAGNMIVNGGIHASCYSSFENQSWQQFFYRVLLEVREKFAGDSTSQSHIEVPFVIRMLLSFTKAFFA